MGAFNAGIGIYNRIVTSPVTRGIVGAGQIVGGTINTVVGGGVAGAGTAATFTIPGIGQVSGPPAVVLGSAQLGYGLTSITSGWYNIAQAASGQGLSIFAIDPIPTTLPSSTVLNTPQILGSATVFNAPSNAGLVTSGASLSNSTLQVTAMSLGQAILSNLSMNNVVSVTVNPATGHVTVVTNGPPQDDSDFGSKGPGSPPPIPVLDDIAR